MQRTFLILFTLIFVSLQSLAQKDSVEATIIRFFDGLSERNANMIKAHATTDFLLLEDGEVWNIDTLISKISAPRRNVKRENSFAFISTEERGNVAWVSYHNTAAFSSGDRQQTVRWLESAVLTRQEGKWKIAVLHSTRLK
jgi:ketosteroid isomerase-like protein